ncbi:ribosome biogenesis protein sqt1 [Moniliophthora roreri MCA 2997]|uniref:Ribosome biogenesis protein sqt1 n=2 Tax=Moniliophthora roreri TaxID=221103 RepID=V2XLN4_MONRO|nr:ribosome biogenesis protein sqt1 [Moniliophthora roreri MCA 2997]KAI3604903.1 ribosome biogenesis protein sqt1 [Moniliophthora roreri]
MENQEHDMDHNEQNEDNSEQFIEQEEILAEIPLDGDHPMDEDEDDETGDILGEMRAGPSSQSEDNSVQAFPNHQAAVFAVAVHPSEPLAVSGGEDDLGYIWDITDGEVITKLSGHTDSVSCVAWSTDGEMVSTGGMDGKIRLWRRVGKENYRTWEFLTELQGPDEVMFLRWHPKGNVLLAGSNDSTLWLWQLPSGNTMQVFAGHTAAVQCGEFTPDGKRIISACADGTFILWDPRSPSPVFKLTPDDARFNLDGITSIGVNPSSSLAIIGGAAGGVRVVSLTKGEIVMALGGHTEGESIEAVAFIDLTGSGSGTGIAATGATDGKICLWDLSTMRLRATLEHEDAVTTLLSVPSPKSHLMVSASADRTLRTWDARTGNLLRVHKGHHAPILGASLGLGGSVVVSAGDDGVCLVFTTEEESEYTG